MAGNIWLASYPKSGNTWMRMFLASLFAGGPVGINQLSLGQGAGYREILDANLGVATVDFPDDVVENLRPRVYSQLAAEKTEPLFWKVHDSFHRTADGGWLFPPESTRCAIYVVRDPRDVVPSQAHHRGISLDESLAILNDDGACLSLLPDGIRRQVRQRVGSWSTHVESWLAAPIALHLVRYEDLLRDPMAVFTKVVRFLGRDDSPSAIAAAIAATSFQKLRENEEKEGFREKLEKASAPFFRIGRSGTWRTSLTLQQVDAIIACHGVTMRRLGYLIS